MDFSAISLVNQQVSYQTRGYEVRKKIILMAQERLLDLEPGTPFGSLGLSREIFFFLTDLHSDLSICCSHLPMEHTFKRNRTTLIPKVGDVDKLRDINNWRPITIDPLILLFAKTIHKRLEN